MRPRCYVALFAICLTAAAQSQSVSALVAQVRAGMPNRKDAQLARDLRKIKLSERLEDRIIENLESEGAGPETVAELLLLRDRSSSLPPPPNPAIPEPAPPAAADQASVWAAAGGNSHAYTESLPDFICSEVVRRYSEPDQKASWRLDDTLALKLTYFDRQEQYDLLSINNRPTHRSFEEMLGVINTGEFGSLLAAIFAPKSRTESHWDHWTLLRSRPAHVYRFTIRAANSDYRITSGAASGEHQVAAGQQGFVYIDAASQMVVRIAASTAGLPADFDVKRVQTLLDYDFVDIGGRSYLLPLHSETLLDAPPFRHRNETDFLAYRKFSADATITFKK